MFYHRATLVLDTSSDMATMAETSSADSSLHLSSRPDIIGQILEPMISRFLERVKFNPVSRTVELIDDPDFTWTNRLNPTGGTLNDAVFFERIKNQSDLGETLDEYARSFGPVWSQVLVFSGILARPVPVTTLSVRNDSGFNSDCRSHRGDDLPEDCLIPAHIPNQPDIPNGYSYGDFYIGPTPAEIRRHNYALSLDTATYNPVWSTESPTGITWGQVMEGVIRVKGSKFDRWYEMFSGVRVSFPTPDAVELSLTFDHGS
jgi:hypothetical protein